MILCVFLTKNVKKLHKKYGGRMKILLPILVFRQDKMAWRPVSDITKIIIHHTAGSRWEDIEQIHQGHLMQGWAGVGYHYLIKYDGSVEKGRPNAAVGAHCQGENSCSLGVAVAGNCEENPPSEAQKESLIDLIQVLRDSYPAICEVKGHRAYAATACPGRYLAEFCEKTGIFTK
jgi:N-acetyl-anhydromuramyl-L-alanine amidase AmpD